MDSANLINLSPQRAAQRVLEKYWDGSLPVNPTQLAHACEVQVLDVIFTGDPEDCGIAGKYEKSGFGGKPTAYFNDLDPLVRQRFTIAHELGHHILGHKDSYRDTDFSSGRHEPDEIAANRFAAALLMPAKIVKHFVESADNFDVRELAQRLQVSEQAMGYRLQNLGLA